MITIPTLSEKDLEVFKGKKVVLHGDDEATRQLIMVFNHFNISVFAIYKSGLRQAIKREQTQNDVLVVGFIELKRLAKQHNNIILQNASIMPDRLCALKKHAVQLGLAFSDLPTGQILASFTPMMHSKLLENKESRVLQTELWQKNDEPAAKRLFDNLLCKKNASAIVLCLPMKTADFTLNNTFDSINRKEHPLETKAEEYSFQISRAVLYKVLSKMKRIMYKKEKRISYLNLFHRPQVIDKSHLEEFGTLKIITAVREPIAQNISALFEEFVTGRFYTDWMFGDIEAVDDKDVPSVLEQTARLFAEGGDDVQQMMEAFIDRYVYPNDACVKTPARWYSVQKFISVFKENVLDITAYPFDQEKGYTIIKEGNVEVFVYQLEKLNSLVPELSAWVGVPFDQLENGNQASDKWIAESYKQAQKEIKITQTYFDQCFDEPYVKHCYSEADIEKFKAKWKSHVRS